MASTRLKIFNFIRIWGRYPFFIAFCFGCACAVGIVYKDIILPWNPLFFSSAEMTLFIIVLIISAFLFMVILTLRSFMRIVSVYLFAILCICLLLTVKMLRSPENISYYYNKLHELSSSCEKSTFLTFKMVGITGEEKNDEACLSTLKKYFSRNKTRLKKLLDEENDSRLKALYCMIIVHDSHVYYATAQQPANLTQYVKQRYSHCRIQSWAHMKLLKAFELEVRQVTIPGHTFVEVMIDGTFEIFDATSNLWIDNNCYKLLTGIKRSYRTFYSRAFDPSYPEYQISMLDRRTNLMSLRNLMIGLGIFYHPSSKQIIHSTS